MPQIAAGIAVVGAGVAAYGAISSANDQANLDNARASVAEQQSQQLGLREQENEVIRNATAERQKLQFGASYAASGKEGVGLGSQLEIQKQTDLQNAVSSQETQFQQNMLLQQAGIDTTLASETETAGTISAISASLGGISKAASLGTSGGANPGYGAPQSMGAYPGPSLGVNTSMGTSGFAGGG